MEEDWVHISLYVELMLFPHSFRLWPLRKISNLGGLLKNSINIPNLCCFPYARPPCPEDVVNWEYADWGSQLFR